MSVHQFHAPRAHLTMSLVSSFVIALAIVVWVGSVALAQQTPSQVPGQEDARPGAPEEFDRAEPDEDSSPEASPPGKQAPRRAQRKRRGSSIPKTAAKRALLLTELYAILATATDDGLSKQTAQAIEKLWLIPGSATVKVLMDRSAKALATKQTDIAIALLDKAATIAPDYPEIFARRAYVHYGRDDAERALGDLRRVLALNPNHFKALEALGQILKELDRKKAALAVYRKLLQVHPLASGAKSTADELAREVEGQPI